MLLRAIFAVACSLSTLAAHAGGLDINLSGDAVKVSYASTLAKQAYWGVSYMNTDDADVIKGGVSSVGTIGKPSNGVTGSIGVNGVVIKNNQKLTEIDDSGGIVTLTGGVTYRHPKYNRVAAMVSVEYGPDVASFGDVEEYSEVATKLSYRVVDSGAAYIGYRHARVDYGSSSATLDSGIMVGYQMAF